MNDLRQNDPSRRRGSLLDVAVVGGGMVGAAAALALARAGFSVALIDAREPAAWAAADEVDLRVVGLAPSSVALLDQLGAWSRIRDARASAYERMHVWDAENGAAIQFRRRGRRTRRARLHRREQPRPGHSLARTG